VWEATGRFKDRSIFNTNSLKNNGAKKVFFVFLATEDDIKMVVMA